MKRKSKFVVGSLIVILLFTLINMGPKIRHYLYKTTIVKIVKDNQEVLNNTIYSKNYKEAHNIKGIKDIDIHTTEQGNLYIDYYCKGVGIVPSGVYYGFFYHGVDEPIGFQGVTNELKKQGKGWHWSQVDGDNYTYVEKIADHWYYYEAGF